MNTSAMPSGACDCHLHLFGPAQTHPFAADRVYTPGDAGEDALLALHARLGIGRLVLILPSPYGTDNSRLLAGLARLGARARGVAVLPPEARPDEVGVLAAAGVRGLRLNVENVLDAADAARSALGREQAAPHGPLRVAAPATFARMHIARRACRTSAASTQASHWIFAYRTV